MNSKWLESNKMFENESLCKLLNNLTEGIHVVDNKGKTILYRELWLPDEF
jgi:hypothetical protein